MSKNIRLVIILLCIIIIAGGFIYHFYQEKQQEEKETSQIEINLGYLVGSQSIPLLIAREKNYFEEEGLKVNFVDLERKRGQEILLLSSGILDCSNSGKLSEIKAIASGKPLRIISSLSQKRGNPIFIPMAKKESGITSMADVRGKIFGFRMGGLPNYVVDKLLVQEGISGSEIEVVELTEPDAIAAFNSDRIDVYIGDILTFAEIKEKFEVVAIADSSTVFPNSYIGSITCREQFVYEHPDKAKKLLKAIYKAAKFINEHPEEAKVILKDLDTNPTWQKIDFPIYAEDASYTTDGIEEMLDWLFSKGLIEKKVDINKIIYRL